MGIVERAAARLAAVPGGPGRPAARVDGTGADAPPAPDGAEGSRAPGLIERVGAAAGGQPAGTSAQRDGTGVEQAVASAQAAVTHGQTAVAVAPAVIPDAKPASAGPQADAGGGGSHAAETAAPATAAAATQGTANPSTNPRILEIDSQWLRQNNIITPDAERTPIEEGFRRIKRHVLANMVNPSAGAGEGAPVNLVMVTSAMPNEGKTFCAINLAISMAMELDHRVLLVDADTVKPSVLPALGLKRGLPGLMDLLADRGTQIEDVLHRTSIDKLSILPAGTPHRYATEMLASETMRTLVRALAERHDDRIVIFDSPPLLVTSEAAVLATHMSQVLVVVASGQTTEASLNDALHRLDGCRQVGLVLNKGEDAGSEYGYGYGYDYG